MTAEYRLRSNAPLKKQALRKLEQEYPKREHLLLMVRQVNDKAMSKSDEDMLLDIVTGRV